MRPCAGPHGHTTWLGGWAAWFDGGFRGAEQARSRTPFPSPTGGDPAPRRAATLWCAGVACACGTMRASACATAEGAGGRVSTPPACLHRSSVGRERLPDHTLGAACRRQRALVVLGFATPSRGVLAGSGAKAAGAHLRIARAGGGLGGAMCMPKGRGRRPRAVARSQTCEDHTTTPRWRARARIVLSRRERPVSRIGQKKEKPTTCEPSTLQRSAWSRPPRRKRSACTSLPRRARTARWKGAGSVYVVSAL